MVRLTDRPDMALDVYRGRKTTIQQQQIWSDCHEKQIYYRGYSNKIVFALNLSFVDHTLSQKMVFEYFIFYLKPFGCHGNQQKSATCIISCGGSE